MFRFQQDLKNVMESAYVSRLLTAGASSWVQWPQYKVSITYS
jgi:hypothetical protein